MSPDLNSLVAGRSPEELLHFLACWTQQLLVELQFAERAGTFVGVPTEVTLAVNVGLEQAGRTPIFIGQADFDRLFAFRTTYRARDEEWWQLH